MSLNARQANVAAGHALFVNSWIQVMPDLPVICGAMQRSAGVMRLLRQPMAPEIQYQGSTRGTERSENQ